MKTPVIAVEAFATEKGNGLMVRFSQERAKEAKDNLIGALIGADLGKESRSCVQFLANSVLEKYGWAFTTTKEGDDGQPLKDSKGNVRQFADGEYDLGKVLGAEIKIQVIENFEPAYEGQGPKMNPSTGEVLTKNGQEIYRHSKIALADANDSLVAHDVSQGETISLGGDAANA